MSASDISDCQQSKGKRTSLKQVSRNKWFVEMVLLNLVKVMWCSDNMLLPAVYTEIARKYDVSHGALSILGLVRGIFESIFALPAGFLADRVSRPILICAGSLIWAGGLIGCLASPTLHWMTFWRAVNGIGLGLVLPLLYSLVADKSSVQGRGRAFGILYFTGNVGQTIFTAGATSIAEYQIAGMAGWQFALLAVALLSAVVGLLVWVFVSEPPYKMNADERSMQTIIRQEAPTMIRIMCIPTFIVIIGQGIFGTAPWFSFSYMTGWLELNCFSNKQAAMILAFFSGGTAFAGCVGGWLLDAVSARFPNHGPPALCQFSALISVPLLALIIFGLGSMNDPQNHVAVYCVVFLFTGILIAWCGTVNNKMFSDIVPQKSFQYVYALDRCIEGVFGALGMPAVGWLTDNVFGFKKEEANANDCSRAAAESLGKGVFTVCAVGFGICFCFYTAAHWTYPQDRLAKKKTPLAEKKLEESDLTEMSTSETSSTSSSEETE